MVFSGPLSAACLPCRLSRRKCDRSPTGCMQCSRKGITCHGYRDTARLRVRDETSKLIQRYENKRKQDSSLPQQSPWTWRYQKRMFPFKIEQTHTSKAPEPAWMLPLDLREIAVTYFMQSYIQSSGFQDYLPELYKAACAAEDNPLVVSTRAAALAAFMLFAGNHTQLPLALEEYSAALARTNLFLTSIDTAISDTTLASVLLLGLFEAIVFQGGKSPEQWMAHTDGALRLLQVRGRRNVESKTAALLYAQTCHIVRTSYIQRSAPIPLELLKLDAELMPYLDLGTQARRFSHTPFGQILDETASIRARLSRCSRQEIIHDALKADQQAEELIERLRDELPYSVSPVDTTAFWANWSIAHKYSSPCIAKLYNSIRSVRLYLNLLIWHTAAIAVEVKDWTYDAVQGESKRNESDVYILIQGTAIINTTALGSDILRSIEGFMTQQESGISRFLPSARTLAWPLALLQNSPIIPATERVQAHMLLGIIGESLHLPQVVNAVSLVRHEDW